MHDSAQRPGTPGLSRWADRPMAVDALIAVVVAVVELVNLHREVTVAGYAPPLPVGAVAVWLVAMSLLLAWRRRRPVLVMVAVGLAAALCGVIDLPTLNLPLLVAIFTAGAALKATATVGVALAAGVSTVNLQRGTLSQLPIDLVVFGAVWLLGIHLRVRQEHARDLHRRREAELWLARSQERDQLTRDLHDIVSNGVGGIYLQAVGAAGLLDEDPRQVRSALDKIQVSARSTLEELRSLLEVLRLDPDDTDREARRRATPSLADLDELLKRTRATGATVLVEIDDDLDGLSAGVSTTGYRTVQEALGNAVRHGRDEPITLRVTATDGLRIEVTNAIAAGHEHGGGGWGLTGMQERIGALGGHLDTRTDGGRFHLTADLPAQHLRR